MKNIALYILILVCLFPASSVVAQQKEYKGKMNVTPLQLEQVGDSLCIAIDFDMRGVRVDSRRSISLIPVLVAPNVEQKLPEVLVKGRANYLTSRRELALMSKAERREYAKKAPYAIIKGYKNDASKQIAYKQTIAFEPWMKQARLGIQKDLCGCGNRPRMLSVSELVNQVKQKQVIAPYAITPYLAYVRPEVEAIKRRELVGEAFLDFVVSKTDIRPSYMNNPRELGKIIDMMEAVKNDSTISVCGISVEGYASPEGGFEFNRFLSENRAKALVGYLLPRFDYPRNMYRVNFGGENWAGLMAAVEASDMQYKDEILSILKAAPKESASDPNLERKRLLKTLYDGVPYRYMLKEYYPALRKAICKIDYEVREFDVVEAAEILKTHPQNLSLNEMFLVANTYEQGSPEFIDVFETAVRTFPEDQTAIMNAAVAALSRKDIAAAERYLSKMRVRVRIPEYDNAIGVLEMLKGNYDKAEEHLKAAAQTGLESASKNLDELENKRQNIMQIEEQNR